MEAFIQLTVVDQNVNSRELCLNFLRKIANRFHVAGVALLVENLVLRHFHAQSSFDRLFGVFWVANAKHHRHVAFQKLLENKKPDSTITAGHHDDFVRTADEI